MPGHLAEHQKILRLSKRRQLCNLFEQEGKILFTQIGGQMSSQYKVCVVDQMKQIDGPGQIFEKYIPAV